MKKRSSANKKSTYNNYYDDDEDLEDQDDDDDYELGDDDQNRRMTVKYSFSINRIEFNSILNKSILDILEKDLTKKDQSDQVRQIIHAFVTEYLRN